MSYLHQVVCRKIVIFQEPTFTFLQLTIKVLKFVFSWNNNDWKMSYSFTIFGDTIMRLMLSCICGHMTKTFLLVSISVRKFMFFISWGFYQRSIIFFPEDLCSTLILWNYQSAKELILFENFQKKNGLRTF